MQTRTSIDPFAAGAALAPGAAVAAPEGAPALPRRVSWGALIAGAVAAVLGARVGTRDLLVVGAARRRVA